MAFRTMSSSLAPTAKKSSASDNDQPIPQLGRFASPSNPQVARDLLVSCLKRLEGEARVFVGVPDLNKAAIGILSGLGFSQYSYSIRMQLGEELDGECMDGVFAIGGPMKG